jgi:hypothetical protein
LSDVPVGGRCERTEDEGKEGLEGGFVTLWGRLETLDEIVFKKKNTERIDDSNLLG